RDRLDAVALGGHDLLAVGAELRAQAEHDRDVRAVHVAVENRDAAAGLRQRERQVHRYGRLADAALARADGDDVLHPLHRLAPAWPPAPAFGPAPHSAVISTSMLDTPSAETAPRA